MTTVRSSPHEVLSGLAGREGWRADTLAKLLPADVEPVSPLVGEFPGVGKRSPAQVKILGASPGQRQRPQPDAHILLETKPPEPIARLTGDSYAMGGGHHVSQS